MKVQWMLKNVDMHKLTILCPHLKVTRECFSTIKSEGMFLGLKISGIDSLRKVREYSYISRVVCFYNKVIVCSHH